MRDSILDYLGERKERQFSLLKNLVLQPSHSSYVRGVKAIGDAIIAALSACELELECFENEGSGRHLLFKSPACKNHSKQLLLFGHMDTIYPLSSGFDWYERTDGKVFGPGVIDMKGGLVAMVFALKALHEMGLLHELPVAFLCNADGEIYSPSSTRLIRAEAVRSFAALGFDCGGLNGEVVTGRKGCADYTIEVRGGAGGKVTCAETLKASAILEMAHKVIALEKLNNPEQDVMVNIDTIEGGTGLNSAAEVATIKVDTTFLKTDNYHENRMAIEEIVKNCQVPGTTATIDMTAFRAPMEQCRKNKDLFYEIDGIARELGIKIREELRSNVSDANTIASCGIPVVDGLGPIGEGEHTDGEYMVEGSLASRTKLATFAIQHVCALYLEEDVEK